MKTATLRYDSVSSPIGRITFAVTDGGVCGLALGEHWGRVQARLEKRFAGLPLRAARLTEHRRCLQAYFDGRIDALDELPVDVEGTPFQGAVWRALRSVKAGRTASYADIARRIGNPAAVRAVGLANGSNPVSLILPCHRIIGSDGSLTGYGGGLDRKRWLLTHEGVLLG
ncbi:MAG TPA: methylated-DNA--[protein]-cysteine S-methyltransferase [Candidatus Limnocylindrales bacterium]|nr:methylated-DNA--[protein]-cysteine S-methyltransferase [Candidatus Limnocylindrales bacterium]